MEFPSRQNRNDFGLHRRTSHNRLAGSHIDIDLAADPELSLKIDSRFDGKAGARQHPSLVTGFESIHVRAVPMHFFAYRMASTMHEVVPISCISNNLTRCRIDLVPSKRLFPTHPFCDKRNRGITGVAHMG